MLVLVPDPAVLLGAMVVVVVPLATTYGGMARDLTGCQGQRLEDTLKKPWLLLRLSGVTFWLLSCDCLSTANDKGDKQQ